MDFKNRHILSINDFSKEELLHILSVARQLETKPQPHLLDGKILAALFFEASTRTRLSFESAMCKLGGKVIGFADPSVTSLKKGESLHDTIKMVEGYADVIAMRHYQEGAPAFAATCTKTPVINAGDGSNQHPTQTFLDLYTIQKSKGTLQNLHVAFVGDLKYGRTVHSLSEALVHFGATLSFVSPTSLKMPKKYLDELKSKGVKLNEYSDLKEILPTVDILYATRIQQERFVDPKEYEKVRGSYKIHPSMLKGVKKEMKIMHPLPRIDEIDTAVDSTPYAMYFEQAKNGIPVRQAVLALVLGAMK